jgi:prepilin-type N-terminal cleavage/methylation domain-containing protein
MQQMKTMQVVKTTNKQQGFTLVELIIAIAIFAVIATASYDALTSFNNSKQIYSKNAKILNKLQEFSLILDRDFNQIFDNDLTLEKEVIVFKSIQNDKLLNIAYNFAKDKIRRKVDDYQETLLDELSEVKIRLLDNNNKWHTKWQKKKDNYIKALELKFEHPNFGEITKLAILDE